MGFGVTLDFHENVSRGGVKTLNSFLVLPMKLVRLGTLIIFSSSSCVFLGEVIPGAYLCGLYKIQSPSQGFCQCHYLTLSKGKFEPYQKKFIEEGCGCHSILQVRDQDDVMIEPYTVSLQILSFGLSDLSKMNASFLFSVTYYEVSTKQFSQLKKGGNALIGNTIEPLLHDPLQRGRAVSAASCITGIIYIHLCRIDIQIIVRAGSWHLDLLRAWCFYDYSTERC